MTSLHGRRADSIADIEHKLQQLFEEHPESELNALDEPQLSAAALPDIFRSFSERFDDKELMTPEEIAMLHQLIEQHGNLPVTPATLLGFIAQRSTKSEESAEDVQQYIQSASAPSSPPSPLSASTSRDSSPPRSSVFDSLKRQRTTPIDTPPSSWNKRPTPANRRKSLSDKQAHSDGESTSPNQTSFVFTPRRSRTPSSPTSPTLYGPSSPTFSSPRSHGRSSSQPKNSLSRFGSPELDYSTNTTNGFKLLDDDPIHDFSTSSPKAARQGSKSPTASLLSFESDNVIRDRERTDNDSTISLLSIDRVEELQQANSDLRRKLMEAETSLHDRLLEHDAELEEMQSRLEEAKEELSATKREEKELRSKERQNTTQITALESEIAKLQKHLENARASYASLQRQYQEQCAESERYRNTLRRRDEELKEFQEASALHLIETKKWTKEQTMQEDRVSQLQKELSVASQASALLDEQKQENMMLKETIDRMRFDMDELRSNLHAEIGKGNSSSSRPSTWSKSLGAEMGGKLKDGKWLDSIEWDKVDIHEDLQSEVLSPTDLHDSAEDPVETEQEDDVGNETVIVQYADDEDSGSEGDIVETIITRKKKRTSSSSQANVRVVQFQDTRTFADATIQYEQQDFYATTSTQTDVKAQVHFGGQTEPEPAPSTSAAGSQTDPEPEPTTLSTSSIEIQTEPFDSEVRWEQPMTRSRSPSPSPAEASMVSSSSTVVPTTPKASSSKLLLAPADLPPPAYVQEISDEHNRAVADAIKAWHSGVSIPFVPISGGISDEAFAAWKQLQIETGVGCKVIDQIVEASEKKSAHRKTPSNKFYKIYNNYVYQTPTGPVSHALMGVGAAAIAFIAFGQVMVNQYHNPLVPTAFYERSTWAALNTIEAAGDGFWGLVGRLGSNAAMTVATGSTTFQ